MPIVTKSGGIVPSQFNGFAVMNDGTVLVGDNTNISGWKNKEKLFSFPVTFNTDYALSVNQDDNIVIYTKNARFVFAKDGTPLTASDNTSVDFESLKKRMVIKTSEKESYVLINRYGVINSVIRVSDGKKTTEYETPLSELAVEFAFWEGNLLLIVTLIAGVLDVRKRRFVAPKNEKKTVFDIYDENVDKKPKQEIALPKFLKAFTKPEISNKGAAFSSEYSTKPGERPRFLSDNGSSDKSSTHSGDNPSPLENGNKNADESVENSNTDAD
ncbi:MAG: hypothetical protein IKC01_09720 [Clostridia bacterium]|nr:hypothetical protein [Clostridia bacterium]